MPKRANNTFSLLRGRVRTSFNKHNLFNLYKKSKPFFKNQTLYQQKWSAKQETRAYHGEHLTEGKWQSTFEPKLQGVAQLDASLKGTTKPTPMVLQTYAALEKRLDFALFRALFASSVRQARKFILTKHVKVNGTTIVHPGYTLKPGDVFSVEPSKVLEALGEKKPSLKQAYKVDKTQVMKWQKYVKEARANPVEVWEKQKNKRQRNAELFKNKYLPEPPLEQSDISQRIEGMTEVKLDEIKAAQKSVSRTSVLRDILNIIKNNDKKVTQQSFEEQFGPEISIKCLAVYEKFGENDKIFKLEGEEFDSEISKIIPHFKDGKPQGEFYSETKYKKIRQLVSEINVAFLEKIRKDNDSKPLSESEIIKNWVSKLKGHPMLPEFSEIEEKGFYEVRFPWQKGMYGLKDPSKPYFTPWRMRPFVAPFAFLPKHLEISFKTCHAVYLRDPVARPGESEVPSPFDEDIHERAFMYYIKRGM